MAQERTWQPTLASPFDCWQFFLIQQHQGTIKVESQVGQGTTFTVRLPGMV